MNSHRLEIISCLRLKNDEILQLWESNLLLNASPILVYIKPSFRSVFKQLLLNLATFFESRKPYQPIAESTEYGKLCACSKTYSLAHLLYEYNTIRQSIFEVLESTVPIYSEERDAILKAIELELSSSASAFMDTRSSLDREGRLNAEASMSRAQEDVKSLQEEREDSLRFSNGLKEKIKSMESDSIVRERFVVSLSHDLRNPIGAAKMAADILLANIPLNDEIEPFTHILLGSLSRAELMLHDLLDMSRIRAGHPIVLKLESCDLTKIVSQVLADIKASKGIDFDFYSETTFKGFWSEGHLRRVLDNLCDNAIKYGDRSRSMSVFASQNLERIEIKVQNFGPPIPISEQKTLFEHFNQLKREKGRSIGGWGIGLSFVKAVTEAHGGTVAVSSDEKQGTIFSVILPYDARPYQPS